MLAKTFPRANALVYGSILLVVLFYGFVLLPRGYFEVPRLKTQDLFFKAAHALRPLPKEIHDIAIVAIDDESLSVINQKWPWEREYYTYVVEQLARAQAKVIGFDIVFLGKSINRASDDMFATEMRKTGNTILASYSSETGGYIRPYEIFARSAAGFGLISKPRDADNLVRSGRLWMREPSSTSIMDYTFEAKTLCRYFDIGSRQMGVKAGEVVFSKPLAQGESLTHDISVPLRKDESFIINYIANAQDFTTIPIWRVIKGQFDPAMVAGKIVLIGQTNEIIHDIHPTPLGPMPGVAISANILLTVLSDRFIREMGRSSGGLELLLFTLLTFIITMRFNAWKGGLACIGLLFLFGSYATFLFCRNVVGDFFSVPFFVPIIFVTIQLYRNISLFVENVALTRETITDGLTGLYIHKYMVVRLQNELERARRYHQKLALGLIDIDFFKKINDTYGHEQGNKALIHFANVLRDSFRKVDLLFRYGGEEFCVVLPGSDPDNAFESVERFRKKLQSCPVRINGQDVTLTASIGLVVLPEVSEKETDMHALLDRADKGLYEAKRTGRNKTCQITDNGPSQQVA